MVPLQLFLVARLLGSQLLLVRLCEALTLSSLRDKRSFLKTGGEPLLLVKLVLMPASMCEVEL